MSGATGTRALRLGTRRSQLAVAQTQLVAAALGQLPVTFVRVSTTGDRSDAPLSRIGGTGVFVGALRESLLAGEVDAVVHSAKDLPTVDDPRVLLAAVPSRADARDALVAGGRRLAELPPGARIGTGSPRRAAQLRRARRDITVVDIRGNVDTRLRSVSEGELDGVVLAAAGLARLGLSDRADEVFPAEQFLPAPGQGALAVECRAGDDATRELLAGIEEGESRQSLSAERALLAGLAVGCSAPVGAYARVKAGILTLSTLVLSPDGQRECSLTLSGPAVSAAAIGHQMAARLLEAGAGELVREQG